MTPTPRITMAILDDWEGVADRWVDWSAAVPDVAVTIHRDHLVDHDDIVARLSDCDIVMLMRERTPFPAAVIERLPRLRLLITTGMRNRSVDVAALQARDVTFCGTGGIATSTSELTWALILALSRGIPAAALSMSQGDWQPTPGIDLHGATLGLVGLGRLGAQVGTVARAFGMSVIAWSPRLTEERAGERGAELVSKSELFGRSDVVSVHMVLAPSTRGLIGAEELRAMKPTAFLVNTSRGPLVDESALLTALHEGWIAGAGIDVYDREPLPPDHPLREAPRTLLTPHLGYVTEGTMRLFYAQAAEDVRAFVDGAPIRLVQPKP